MAQRLKLLLLRPYSEADELIPPFGLGYLATALRKENDAQILDGIKENMTTENFADFIGKNKAWETFYRDIEIYNLYKKMKDPKIKRQPNFQAIDAKLWAVFEKRWPNLTMSGIRTIINRTRKRLGEI